MLLNAIKTVYLFNKKTPRLHLSLLLVAWVFLCNEASAAFFCRDLFVSRREYFRKIQVQRLSRLTEIYRKNRSGEDLSKEDIQFLYLVDKKIEGNPDLTDTILAREIISTRDIKTDLAYAYDCKREQISTTKEEALSGDIIFHHGVLELSNLPKGFNKPLPKYVSGTLIVKDYDGQFALPSHVARDVFVYLLGSSGKRELPEYVGGDLKLVKDGYVPLVFPKHVGGNVTAENVDLLVTGTILPKYVGGDVNLSLLISVEQNVTPLKHVNGDIYIQSLKSADEKARILPANFPSERVMDADGLWRRIHR